MQLWNLCHREGRGGDSTQLPPDRSTRWLLVAIIVVVLAFVFDVVELILRRGM